MIPLGCSTLGFRFDPLPVALTEIAAQGFRLVDIAMYPNYCPHFDPVGASDVEKDNLRRQLDDLGLTVATINAGHGLFGVPSDRERQIDFVKASLRLAQELGAYGVTTQSGLEPAPGQWH